MCVVVVVVDFKSGSSDIFLKLFGSRLMVICLVGLLEQFQVTTVLFGDLVG